MVVLGDDANKAAVIDGWLPKVAGQHQDGARLRAAAMKKFARGNRSTSFPFTAERTFSTYGESLKFIRDHFLALPEQGLVEISQSGDHAFVLYLADAVIDAEVILLIGVTVKVRYQIEGGIFQVAAPSNTLPL